jgi:cyclase
MAGTTRREWLQAAASITGGAVVGLLYPEIPLRAALAFPQQAAPADAMAAFRAQLGSAPIQSQKLGDALTLLSGPGGNVVVLNGPDGKIVVDTFVQPAWPKLKEALDGLGSAPLKLVIDTHWHFDHTDNNASLHAAGAKILAHENTKKRMSEAHDVQPLGLHVPASPAEALPQQTFPNSHKLQANGQSLTLVHLAPAHTDSDIYVHYEKVNVLHCGDVFFNGVYPFIDGSTGGSMNGMIAGCNRLLELVDNNTQIVPGHGPLGNKGDLTKFRDMLSTARDRVQKLKAAGKTVQEAVAAKPFSDLEADWGKGHFNGDMFVQIVYLTL